MPGGVWREDTGQWVHCRALWLFRKESLAKAFRNRYIKRLKALRRQGKLNFRGEAAQLTEDADWNALMDLVENQAWVVYPKPAPAGAATALDYLGRYTHKVAISDHRVLAIKNGVVTYSWRDRNDNNKLKTDQITCVFLQNPALPS